MENRSFAAGGQGYRFGFQGQEMDDEVAGKGNSYAFKYRIHDARIGRFLSIDPLASKFAWNSPYAFAENKVLAFLEFEGLEAVPKDQIWNISKVSAPVTQYETGKWTRAKVEGHGSRIHKITSGENEGNFVIRQYVGTSTTGHQMYKDAFIVGANRISEFANNAVIESVDEGVKGIDVWNEYQAKYAGDVLGANDYGGAINDFDYGSYIADQWTDPEKLLGLASMMVAGPKPNIKKAKWAQTTYGKNFSKTGKFAGKSVEDLTSQLRNGTMKASDVPINVIVRDGETFILNTRSSAALTEAGIPRSQWSVINRTGNNSFESMLEGQLGRNNIPNGTNSIRQSGTNKVLINDEG